jgi:hypothetical protein
MFGKVPEAMCDEDHCSTFSSFTEMLEELELALGVHGRAWLVNYDETDSFISHPHKRTRSNESLEFTTCLSVRQ